MSIWNRAIGRLLNTLARWRDVPTLNPFPYADQRDPERVRAYEQMMARAAHPELPAPVIESRLIIQARQAAEHIPNFLKGTK